MKTLEYILWRPNYGELILCRPNTETLYDLYIYIYVDPIKRPYTKIFVLKFLQNGIDCKNNELDRKTLYLHQINPISGK